MEKHNRQFEGIWIPKEIWLSNDLTLQEKVFLVEIKSLDNEQGCFATNGYFSEFFGISKTRVSLVIKSLIDKGYIRSTIIYKEGTKQILKRVLNITYRGYITKVKEPTQQKLKDNNTINNTINNNYDEEEIFNVYQQEIGLPSPMITQLIQHWIEEYPKDYILEAIRMSVLYNARSPRYIESILKDWKENGIDRDKKKKQSKPKEVKKNLPEWFDEEVEKVEPTQEELDEMKKLFNRK